MSIGVPAPRITTTMGIVETKPFKSVAPKVDTPDTYRFFLDKATAKAGPMPGTQDAMEKKGKAAPRRDTCGTEEDKQSPPNGTKPSFFKRLFGRR